jgi:hypothetical protein
MWDQQHGKTVNRAAIDAAVNVQQAKPLPGESE